jgi:beta-glucosidase/6-phospho-beta-glucosidase/beta-galactosidase
MLSEPSIPRPGTSDIKIGSDVRHLLNGDTLPDYFIWGLASGAYQVEGTAKDEGKGLSIWDLIAHKDYGAVADNSTGDVVASFYYLYKQDFARLASLGAP